MIGQSLAHYKITAKLGEGGMGEVYRATDAKLNRDVALKLLPESLARDPERMARFQREAQVLAALNHPNIAAIYGIEERALVMELVEGQTLGDLIKAGPVPIETALNYARQITSAIEAAHEKSITHRDLKPANIMVTTDGQVKVLDFGLASVTQPAAARGDPNNSPTLTMAAAATRMGVIMGTAGYMAPEQARGEQVDKRADIWAFGVVLFEMLSGKRLFVGETVSDTMAQVLTRDPDWTALPSTTPLHVRRLLRRCLERDRKKRLRDIGDAWQEAEEASGISSEPAGSPVAPAKRPLPWMIAAGVMAVVAIVSAAALYRATRTVERPLIRVDADLGPDVTLGPARGAAVILSPDGARQAMISVDAVGKTHLMIRRMDQPKAVPIEETEGVEEAIFSPDSQWIAFYAERKLKKVSVEGGAALTLCDAPSMRGVSWGEDGNIIASLSLNTGLSRIPANGGQPVAITQFDTKRGELRHRHPQILPGGKAVLFTASARANIYDDAILDVVSLADGSRKTVHKGGAWGRYLPTGHLIFLHKGTLFAAPFSLDRLEVTGVPAPILEEVASTIGRPQFDYSMTGTAVYQPGDVLSQAPRTIQWLEPSGKTDPLLSKPGVYGIPRIAPDGRRLAVSIFDGVRSNIWAYDFQRDTLTRLTFGIEAAYPTWTPDGRGVVYAESGGGMFLVPADGSGKPQRLTESPRTQTPSSFSPDGKRLAYIESTSTFDIWTLPMQGDAGQPRPGKPELFQETQFLEYGPEFSPDGKWLAYSADDTGTREVYVRAFPDATGGKWQISSGGGRDPVWSRNGRELFFQTTSGHLMAAAYRAAGGSFVSDKPRVWAEKPVATLRFFLGAGLSRNFDIAPDGKRFAFVMDAGDAGGAKPRTQVTFLFNFFDELRRRVPVDGKP